MDNNNRRNSPQGTEFSFSFAESFSSFFAKYFSGIVFCLHFLGFFDRRNCSHFSGVLGGCHNIHRSPQRLLPLWWKKQSHPNFLFQFPNFLWKFMYRLVVFLIILLYAKKRHLRGEDTWMWLCTGQDTHSLQNTSILVLLVCFPFSRRFSSFFPCMILLLYRANDWLESLMDILKLDVNGQGKKYLMH